MLVQTKILIQVNHSNMACTYNTVSIKILPHVSYKAEKPFLAVSLSDLKRMVNGPKWVIFCGFKFPQYVVVPFSIGDVWLGPSSKLT